jgi:hypothetical protein
LCSDSTGKRKPDNPGNNKPNIEGPRNIPATISPITVGCLILVKKYPKILAVIMIEII